MMHTVITLPLSWATHRPTGADLSASLRALILGELRTDRLRELPTHVYRDIQRNGIERLCMRIWMIRPFRTSPTAHPWCPLKYFDWTTHAGRMVELDWSALLPQDAPSLENGHAASCVLQGVEGARA
jgi:hypothetical protein